MPEAIVYLTDPNSNKAQSLENAFIREFNDRAKIIKRSWDYYNGDHDLPLKPQKDGYNDNVIVNHVEALAERITAFLLGDGIIFDAGVDGIENQTDDEIKELWQANRGMILQENIALSGAIEGHCAVRLIPAEDGWPRLNRLKQANFSAFWDELDMSRVLWYRLQHQAGGMGRRIDYVKGALSEDGKRVDYDAADTWLEFVYETKGEITGNMLGASTRWKLKTFEDRPNPMVWEYPFPPIVDWQNLPNPNGYYGRNDIKGAVALNDALNFILSNAQRIIKQFAAPKTVGTGFMTDELVQTQVGGLYTVSNPEAKIYNLEMQSEGPLVQWMTDMILSGLWESGGMVDPATMKDRVGQLTNFGLQILFANAIQKTNKKRLLYQEAFEMIAKHCLILTNRPVPDIVKTIWPNALPRDEQAEVQTLSQELQEGAISMETYRLRRRYDHDKENERLANEGRQNGNIGATILAQLNNNRTFNQGQ